MALLFLRERKKAAVEIREPAGHRISIEPAQHAQATPQIIGAHLFRSRVGFCPDFSLSQPACRTGIAPALDELRDCVTDKPPEQTNREDYQAERDAAEEDRAAGAHADCQTVNEGCHKSMIVPVSALLQTPIVCADAAVLLVVSKLKAVRRRIRVANI